MGPQTSVRHARRIAALILAAQAALPAAAATITVTTSGDIVGADGKCSLREAISNVNAHAQTVAGAGECASGNAINDTIVVPAGDYVLGIHGAGEDNNASGDLDIRANVDIEGAGIGQTVIDGDDADRVFDLPVNGLNVSMQDLTIQSGHLPGHRGSLTAVDHAVDGGGIFVQNGTLGLLRVELTSNEAGNGSTTDDTNNAGGDGGAIFASSSNLVIVDSELSANRSGPGVIVGGFDGYGGDGGAIFQLGGSMLIQGSRFLSNQTADGTSVTATAGSGAALKVQTGSITIQRSEFDANASGTGATQRGGGGALQLAPSAASLIEQTSITRNAADVAAGAHLLGADFTLRNVTVSDNSADTRAGGLYLDSITVQLDFVTVTDNNAPSASGIYAKNTYYNAQMTTAQANLRNTIVSGNHGSNGCVTGDAHSSFVSQGHNIVGGGCPNVGAGDVATTNPQLGPLADNGGTGFTHLPMIGSPALDGGSCAASGISIDQRGDARPADIPRVTNAADGCDIGALELDDDLFWDGFDG